LSDHQTLNNKHLIKKVVFDFLQNHQVMFYKISTLFLSKQKKNLKTIPGTGPVYFWNKHISPQAILWRKYGLTNFLQSYKIRHPDLKIHSEYLEHSRIVRRYRAAEIFIYRDIRQNFFYHENTKGRKHEKDNNKFSCFPYFVFSW